MNNSFAQKSSCTSCTLSVLNSFNPSNRDKTINQFVKSNIQHLGVSLLTFQNKLAKLIGILLLFQAVQIVIHCFFYFVLPNAHLVQLVQLAICQHMVFSRLALKWESGVVLLTAMKHAGVRISLAQAVQLVQLDRPARVLSGGNQDATEFSDNYKLLCADIDSWVQKISKRKYAPELATKIKPRPPESRAGLLQKGWTKRIADGVKTRSTRCRNVSGITTLAAPSTDDFLSNQLCTMTHQT